MVDIAQLYMKVSSYSWYDTYCRNVNMISFNMYRCERIHGLQKRNNILATGLVKIKAETQQGVFMQHILMHKLHKAKSDKRLLFTVCAATLWMTVPLHFSMSDFYKQAFSLHVHTSMC